MQTQHATEEITKKIDALQNDAAGSVDAVHRIALAIEAIRPVFENVNGAVAEQNATTHAMGENVASTSHFIASVGDSAAEIDSAAREAEAHGEQVASAGKAVTSFAQKLKTRCAVLLGQDGREDRRKRERLPCNLKIEIPTAHGPVIAAVYELSMEGILISGADAGRLPLNQSLDADTRRHRRLPDPHHRAREGRRAGAVRGAGCRLEREDRRQIVDDPR